MSAAASPPEGREDFGPNPSNPKCENCGDPSTGHADIGREVWVCGTVCLDKLVRPQCGATCAHGRRCSNRSVEAVEPAMCGNHHRQRKREPGS